MIKKAIISSFIVSLLFSCDCSSQTGYAYAIQIKLLKKAYIPVKKEINNIKKELRELIKEKKLENMKLKNQLKVVEKQSLDLANIAFYFNKANNYPFYTFKDLENKLKLFQDSIKKK